MPKTSKNAESEESRASTSTDNDEQQIDNNKLALLPTPKGSSSPKKTEKPKQQSRKRQTTGQSQANEVNKDVAQKTMSFADKKKRRTTIAPSNNVSTNGNTIFKVDHINNLQDNWKNSKNAEIELLVTFKQKKKFATKDALILNFCNIHNEELRGMAWEENIRYFDNIFEIGKTYNISCLTTRKRDAKYNDLTRITTQQELSFCNTTRESCTTTNQTKLFCKLTCRTNPPSLI